MKNREFRELVNQWKTQHIINDEQAHRMLTDLDYHASKHSSKKLVSSLSTIGALAFGLGLLLLIAANWTEFGREMKLLFAVLLPTVPLVLTYWLIVVKGSERMYARAANTVGILLIGGALALIGQIYHLENNLLNFFGIWTLLSTPFIFSFRKEENALLTLILLGVTIFFAFINIFEEQFVDHQIIFFVMSVVYLFYGYVLYRAGTLFRESVVWAPVTRVMRLSAGVFSIAVLFLMTFEFYAEAVAHVFSLSSASEPLISFILNVLYIGFLFFVLVRAYRYEEDQVASMVLRWFGIYLIVKYVTLFGNMLDTGLFFVIGGALFIIGGWFLEHKQDEIATYMKRTLTTRRTDTDHSDPSAS